MKLYQFAVLCHPTDKERDDGAVSTIVVPVKTVVARDNQAATLLAGRAIPEGWLDKLDRLEVVVRPF